MNNALRIALLPLMFCIAAALPAGGKKDEKNNAAQEETSTVVRVTGSVRLVGNEPFTQFVISGQDKQWYIADGEEHLLKDLQHRNITVEGLETITNLIFANGRPAGIKRTLSRIRIISVQ